MSGSSALYCVLYTLALTIYRFPESAELTSDNERKWVNKILKQEDIPIVNFGQEPT